MRREVRSLRNRVNIKLRNRANLPRVSFFRSNRHLYLQLIDDIQARTFLSSSDFDLKGSRSERADLLGRRFGRMMIKGGFSRAVFDRSWYRYHGVTSRVADAIRESGVEM